LVGLKCGSDLLLSGVFPNAKEITESFGAYSAVKKYLKTFSLNDPNITCVCVGDGNTPRTAATFAYRSRWQAISVDPRLKKCWIKANNKQAIQRIDVRPKRIEDVRVEADSVVLVAVHSHADLRVAIKSIVAKRIAVVAMPCCVKQELDTKPDIEFRDTGIWSMHNLIKIWKDYENN
jgi:hypothetical protein